MNVLLTVILFIDFVYRLLTAPSQVGLLLPPVRLGRPPVEPAVPPAEDPAGVPPGAGLPADAGRGGRLIGHRLLRNRAGSALLSLLLMGILVLEFGSLWMLALEQDAPDANITTASDALWYVVVTISTVGYGDQYPVTNEGRILGAGIIVVGVGIFGTFTGYLANLFLAPKPRWTRRESRRRRVADDTRERVAQLRVLLAEQQAAVDELDGLLTRKAPGPTADPPVRGRVRAPRCRPAGGDGDPTPLGARRVRGAQRVDAQQHQRDPDDAEADPQRAALTCSPSSSDADEQLQHRGDELDAGRRSPAAPGARPRRRGAAAPR